MLNLKKKIQAQNNQEIWNTMKGTNLRIIGIEEEKKHRSKAQIINRLNQTRKESSFST